jgi:DNA-binding transcriptional ArsR family regulator
VQILVCLAGGAHSVSDLVERLGLEQSAISHQLRVLRDHSLVRVERHGRRRVYRLYDEHVLALLNEAIRHVEERRGIRRGDARSSVLAHVPLAADQ